VNLTFLSLRAASRIRSSALCESTRRCVRDSFCSRGFLLASPLPSTGSAAACAALFACFSGTTELSDSSCSFISGLRP